MAGKLAKIPSPDVLEDYINVADKAVPVVQKAGDVVIDLVNKAAPTLENVGNCACNIVDRAVDSADNIIDKVIDIPFKFIRKAKDSNSGGVKGELKEAIGLIKDVEIKTSLIQSNVISNTNRITTLNY